ncbi:tRNA 2-thiouridine(34) synthase MnmA [archaeon CG10_big_fil_rev_8_21_14_0_10_43_11]|nr:MAG: tRNA 2-thiouridine(34) synthase MnmA [archaeon CG10_big_fil_rev_8_21_14_0_10_43_11]
MKIACLVSGGVDSSVALALLQQQGHDVHAFYLKIWLEDELSYLGNCPWEEDLEYVQKTCKQLRVPFTIINLQKEYFDTVVSYTLKEVKQGRTPNPDMLCNARIKFDAFLKRIDTTYKKVATGHYAGIEEKEGLFYLKQNPDPVKDQTYFLAHLSQTQLARIVFPLANLTKKEVRRIAHELDLPSKNRKDSQGICFLGKIRYTDFLKHYFGEKKGNIIDAKTNTVLGTHKGYWNFTRGQRKGLRLGGGPWYVVYKNPRTNEVFVTNGYDSFSKERKEAMLANLNWIPQKPENLSNLKVKIRHGPVFYQSKLSQEHDTYTLTISAKDQGLAPGQFIVFYHEKYCYGCGVITDAQKS